MTNLKLVENGLEEISFPLVTEETLFTHGHFNDVPAQPITSHKGIELEGLNIAVVGINYHGVQNHEVYTDMELAIMMSKLDKTGMTRKIELSNFGARTVVTYTFPAHTIEVADKDPVCLTIKVLNSYDGGWRFMSMVGANREICSNGMVVFEGFSSFYGKHTKNLDTDVAVEKLGHALEVYTKTAELWKQYPSTKVTSLQANRVFTQLCGGEGKNLKRLELLKQTHVEYVAELGDNLWALFNTLTEWSTHAKFKNEKNKASTVISRENKIRKVLPMLEDIRRAA